MSGQTPSVLVLDDEDLIRESLQFYLEAEGWSVTTAATAEEALELVPAGRFQLAIVDIRLPGMSGRDFVLKAHAERPELRFLIYTGSAAFQIDQDLIRIGMTPADVIAKPVDDLRVIADAARKALPEGRRP